MAPISDKRLQSQPRSHGKESANSFVVHNTNGGNHNGNHMLTHTKENVNARHSKRGLEILDFHESWLEEMEIYKDQMCVQRHQQQQLLSTHNHVHTPEGCQLQSLNASLINAITAAVTAKTTFDKTNHYVRPRSSEQNGSNKSRTVPNSAAVAAAASAMVSANTMASPAADNRYGELLILKRPREELILNASAKAVALASNSKRHARPHQSASPPSQNSGKSGYASTSAGNSNKPSGKIIINQFHASTLLNAYQHEEKTKILAQNGLTKSAATAYETSLYASHYLPQDSRAGVGTLNTARPLNGEQLKYVGVSLAKNGDGGDTERIRATGGGVATVVDDPCAAIDDMNEYTDSESEEEYTGYPFYLEEDGTETHQSRNIRYNADHLLSDDDESEYRDYYTPKSILTPSIFPNVPPYLNFSSHAVKGPPMPATLHKVLKWKLSPVMPKIVKRVVLNSGFRIIKNTTDWMAIWEKHMKSPGFRTIRSHQKYNHMPGSFRIGRKDSIWRSIYNNMKKFGCKEFGFMQKSYVMPDDLESLRQVWPKSASKLTKWIVKPPASARGTGIRIVNKWSQFPKDRPLVVQKYIERPLLINDNKFDMRIYVVVTSINPLRIYMYKDGLARFASVKYSSELNSLDDRCMHLTNYSINKFSENYSKNEDFNACQGHKWTLQSLWSCLEGRGINTKRLWATLRNLVIKSIISGESGLNRMYRQNVNFRYNCFELFGFDVLLDENLVPWLLEINISPSLHSELPLDLHVKGPLIQAVLNTALYQIPPKLAEQQQKDIQEELNLGGPLCHDKRIFTTCLTTEEVRKHNQFTNRSIEFREEYVESILENLLPDDVRCLIITEDEFARSQPLERIFPTPGTHVYLKFIDNPRYYNRLIDAWESRYGNCREEGIALLRRLCQEEYHLQVSDAALEKEPNVAVTEIDLLHAKKSEDLLTDNFTITSPNSANASKAGSPDSNTDRSSTGVTTRAFCAKDSSAKSIKDNSSDRTLVMSAN